MCISSGIYLVSEGAGSPSVDLPVLSLYYCITLTTSRTVYCCFEHSLLSAIAIMHWIVPFLMLLSFELAVGGKIYQEGKVTSGKMKKF